MGDNGLRSPWLRTALVTTDCPTLKFPELSSLEAEKDSVLSKPTSPVWIEEYAGNGSHDAIVFITLSPHGVSQRLGGPGVRLALWLWELHTCMVPHSDMACLIISK